MAVDGRTRDPRYRNIVQLYEFDKLQSIMHNAMGRRISPSDIDGRYFIHVREHDFLMWFEFSTDGKPVHPMQLEALDCILKWGGHRAALVLATHPPLQPVNVPADLTSYAIRMRDAAAGRILQTRTFKEAEDCKIEWWISEWAKHAIHDTHPSPNHFVTAFRQAAEVYPMATPEGWDAELSASTPTRVDNR